MTEQPKKIFTFSTGHSVEWQQVSHNLMTAAYRSMPTPRPPTQLIDGVEIPNFAHPDYQQAMVAHAVERTAMLQRFILKRGVKVVLDDDKRAAVSQLRQDMSELGVPLPDDDTEVWFYHIAIGTDDDERGLLARINGESFPTEEHVQDAISTFQGDVS